MTCASRRSRHGDRRRAPAAQGRRPLGRVGSRRASGAAREAVAADGAAPASAPARRARSSDTGRPCDRVYRLPKLGQDHTCREGIAELTRRGLRVGSLKHHGHHGFDIDVPAKDTWRHHQVDPARGTHLRHALGGVRRHARGGRDACARAAVALQRCRRGDH
ncbi:MAG: molybdopterin-guanine dinucleotide biosynthesis protein B [Collinsella sp.]